MDILGQLSLTRPIRPQTQTMGCHSSKHDSSTLVAPPFGVIRLDAWQRGQMKEMERAAPHLAAQSDQYIIPSYALTAPRAAPGRRWDPPRPRLPRGRQNQSASASARARPPRFVMDLTRVLKNFERRAP